VTDLQRSAAATCKKYALITQVFPVIFQKHSASYVKPYHVLFYWECTALNGLISDTCSEVGSDRCAAKLMRYLHSFKIFLRSHHDVPVVYLSKLLVECFEVRRASLESSLRRHSDRCHLGEWQHLWTGVRKPPLVLTLRALLPHPSVLDQHLID
jgi:hypothetical protein